MTSIIVIKETADIWGYIVWHDVPVRIHYSTNL